MNDESQVQNEHPGDEKISNPENPQPASPAAPTIDPEKWNQFIQQKKMEQSLLLGTVACIVAALVGAALWAIISVSTNYQIGYMAVGVGFLVGFANRYFGKGIDKTFGYLGATFAFLGCVLGNTFTLIGLVANSGGQSFFETLGLIDWTLMPGALISASSPIDILFYGLAIYEGYRFSFKRITEEEARSLMTE